MIETKALVKTFDRVRALDGLDLHVPKGAVYGLVGPNGAGKSTLIRHLTGIYRPDSGEALIDGQPVYENPAVKARIAYIPDEIFYYNQASIRDMKNLARSVYPHFDEGRWRALGKLFALDPRRQVRRLSKGMQKQAAFWIALSQRPEVMILDEPVDGLDPVMRRQVWSELLGDVAANGTTVLVSSHNLRELEDVCDHVGIMKNGKMLLERALSEMQDNLVKIQIALPEGTALPEDLQILHRSENGRLQQLILRGKSAELTERLGALHPVFLDPVPLSLEEIFLYELGGEGHEITDLVV
ncbi:MAG: ATP-binding cassette domain-containing protein [Oscillospiraceae bacterium]|nr:ATP-binding cassette domain-containing protein [Oscillospiraceae bacterium]